MFLLFFFLSIVEAHHQDLIWIQEVHLHHILWTLAVLLQDMTCHLDLARRHISIVDEVPPE